MPENTNFVVSAATTAVISLVGAVRYRSAFKKEQVARMHLAAELAAAEYRRAILEQMIADRGIVPTEEEARKLTIADKF